MDTRDIGGARSIGAANDIGGGNDIVATNKSKGKYLEVTSTSTFTGDISSKHLRKDTS